MASLLARITRFCAPHNHTLHYHIGSNAQHTGSDAADCDSCGWCLWCCRSALPACAWSACWWCPTPAGMSTMRSPAGSISGHHPLCPASVNYNCDESAWGPLKIPPETACYQFICVAGCAWRYYLGNLYGCFAD